jgi:glycosyltransferase involved in cell wall biosynthesis
MATPSKKKVLFLITKSNWGGAQRYVYDLATNLDRSKFDATVALGGDGALVDMLHNAGIQTIELKEMKNTTSVKQLWRAGRELYQILETEQVDVFHLNSTVAGLIGAFVGRIYRVPKIIFSTLGWAFNEDRPQWQRVIIKFLQYLTVLFSHRTIAISTSLVTQMNWPGVQKKMKVVYPGRAIGAMYNRTEAREKIVDFFPGLLPYQSDTWLVCIAELHPIKRHRVLIEAFAQLAPSHPTLRLVYIGEGSERPALETQISTLGLTEKVFLTGNIPEAARFLKGFDIFALASKSEAYGYVLLEAGLAGLPVVATNVGGIPDIVENSVSGLLVPPDNAPAMAFALETILTQPELAKTLSTALHTAMLDRTISKMTYQTSALYEEIT